MPIIGHISLAKDMKAALQEEEEEETNVQRDAKGREILSPEEKARREEKARKAAAEVSGSRRGVVYIVYDTVAYRKPLRGPSVCRSLWRIWTANCRYLRNPRPAQAIRRCPRASGRSASLKQSRRAFIRLAATGLTSRTGS